MTEIRALGRVWPTAVDYRRCQAEGLSVRETAGVLEVSRATVRNWRAKLGLKFVGDHKSGGRSRRCVLGGCREFMECQRRVGRGEAALCEGSISVVGQPETRLWSRQGGREAIEEYY